MNVKDASPYQISMAMRISRDEARAMHQDTSGSTYTRDVLGTRVHFDSGTRELISTVISDLPVHEYVEVVFMQGDEGREVTDRLFDVEGVVQHGATAESIAEAVEYLKQWETGDEEVKDMRETGEPWGTMDRTWTEGEYILSANDGLGYVGLIHVLSRADRPEYRSI